MAQKENFKNRLSPLSSVFTEEEILRLRRGKCLLSEGSCSEFVSNLLTSDLTINRHFQSDLIEWYNLAKEKGCETYFRNRLRSTVNDRSAFLQVIGELMAGYFLYHNVDSMVEYSCATEGADFSCILDERTVNFEVKTAVGNTAPEPGDCGIVDPSSPAIYSLLEQSRKRLRIQDSNVILVVDWHRPPLDVDDILQAMYGTYVVAGPIGGPLVFKRLRDGKCGPNQMTRVGAIGVIHRLVPGELCAWFVHNMHARLPVPQTPLDPWSQLVPTIDGYNLRWRNDSPDKARPIKKS